MNKKLKKNPHRVKNLDDMGYFFGFQKINFNEKQILVNKIFSSVSEKYDFMNDIMSIGIHRFWKNTMISMLSPPRNKRWNVLDVASGTGDIAFRIIKESGKFCFVTILDINKNMINIGKKKAIEQNIEDRVTFLQENAESLPFKDNSFEAYTISFGIRNIPNITKTLQEAFRVLKPGGHFICLEFSEISIPVFKKIYDIWSFYVIPKFGKIFTNNSDAYLYLVESIRKFPKEKEFSMKIQEVGFIRVNCKNLTGGIATIYSGWKI